MTVFEIVSEHDVQVIRSFYIEILRKQRVQDAHFSQASAAGISGSCTTSVPEDPNELQIMSFHCNFFSGLFQVAHFELSCGPPYSHTQRSVSILDVAPYTLENSSLPSKKYCKPYKHMQGLVFELCNYMQIYVNDLINYAELLSSPVFFM